MYIEKGSVFDGTQTTAPADCLSTFIYDHSNGPFGTRHRAAAGRSLVDPAAGARDQPAPVCHWSFKGITKVRATECAKE